MISSSNKLRLKCDSKQVKGECGMQWNCSCQLFFFPAPGNISPTSLVEADEAPVIQKLILF